MGFDLLPAVAAQFITDKGIRHNDEAIGYRVAFLEEVGQCPAFSTG
jgi:hypothetical protein